MVKTTDLPKEKQELIKKLSKTQIVGPCSVPHENIDRIIEVAKKVRVKVNLK